MNTIPEEQLLTRIDDKGLPFFPAPRPRAQSHATLGLLTDAIIWALGAAVVVFWFAGGAWADLTRSFPMALQALGALVGLFAAFLLLMQILLMARVPFIERGLGRDVIVAVHRKLGFRVFWLVLLHVLLVSVGYSFALPRFAINRNPLVQFTHILSDFQGADLAFLGTLVLFGAVILMSLPSIRKKFRYEIWLHWHLLAYVGVLLVLPHQIWSGGSFISSRPARIFWWTLWAVVLLSALVFRLIRPLWNWHKHQLRIVSAEPDGTRGIAVQMNGRHLNQLHARAGQFFIWRFLDGEPGWWQGHPFSLSMPPTDDKYQICVRVVGDGTERIKKLKPGTRVIAEGPYGRVNGDLRTGNNLLMFAAGAGLGPMLSILGEQSWGPGEATLVTRDNSEEEAMMTDQIQALVDQRGLKWERLIGKSPDNGSRWHPAVDDKGTGLDGSEVIQKWVNEMPGKGTDNLAGTDVFMCGPPPWMDGVKKDMAKAGIPHDQIHIEEFAF